MPRIESSAAVEEVRQLAGNCEVRVVTIDPNAGTITVKTTVPGKLIGPKATIVKDFRKRTGWSLVVEPLSLPGATAIQQAEQLDGIRRVEIKSEGPKEFWLHAVFDVGKAPSKPMWTSFFESTGWRLEVAEESDPLPAQEAFSLLANRFPTMAPVGYREFANSELRLFAVHPEQALKDEQAACEEMRRMIGWRTVSVHPAHDMPQDAQSGELDPENLMGFDLSIMKDRCGACMGTGSAARPQIDAAGISWTSRTCPSCNGSGNGRRRHLG